MRYIICKTLSGGIMDCQMCLKDVIRENAMIPFCEECWEDAKELM